MSRESWQDFQTVREQVAQGYLFDQTAVRPVTPQDIGNGNESLEGLPQPASNNGYSVTRPVAVHGEVIGKLGVYDDPDHPLTPEDQEILDSVAGQVAEALERARLLEQTQTALAETGILYDAGRRLNEAGNLQEIVAAVAETVASPAINRVVLVTFDYDLAVEVEAMTVAANWYSGQGTLPAPVGTRYSQTEFASAWVFLSPKSIFLDDILQDERIGPAMAEILRRQSIRAMAVLPLWAGPRQLGALLLQAEDAHPFTEREIQPYNALAGQMATTIENQRLLEQVQQRVAERAALNEVSLAVLSQTDPLAIYQVAAQALVDDFNMSFARVWVLDDINNDLILQVSAGEYTHLDGPHSRVSLNSGRKLAWIAGRREPHISNNLLDDPHVDDKTWVKESATVAFAGYPLVAGDVLLGVLGMFSRRPISEETLSLLQSVAVLIGTVVNTRRLFEQAETALAEVEATQRRYTLQAWETYRARGVTQSHEQTRIGVEPLGQTLPPEVGQAVAQKQTLTTSSRLRLAAGNSLPAVDDQRREVKSTLIAPLTVRNEVIGVLGLQDLDERDWSPEEIGLVEAIAEQIAQAAENIRLIDETQQRAAREKRVGEIGEKIRAAQSLEEALQIAVKEVGLSLEAPETRVQLGVK